MSASTDSDSSARGYHHGDLRRALLEAALSAIAEEGAANLRLRDVARRAGVSHAAPAHHFKNREALLTAIAADGFELLASALRETYERTGSFIEVGVTYVRFAVDHRAHFEVMFRPELQQDDEPSLVAAKSAAAAMLYGPVGELVGSDADVTTQGLAAWALVHGLATLFITNNLPEPAREDVDGSARRVASLLFPGSTNSTRPS